MKPYYYVYNRRHGLPTVRIESLAVAEQSAKRMAAEFPNEEFEILTIVAIVQQTDASLVYSDGIDFCQGHTNLDLP